MKKYDLYMVKMLINGDEIIVKSNADTTSYNEMKELYKYTKETVVCDNVILIGINSMGYTTLESKLQTSNHEIDVVVENLINNIKWLMEYEAKSQELFGSMNMSRDMFLKNVELFEEDNSISTIDSLKIKEDIFNSLKEILVLRRKVKYSNILVKKISSRLNLERVLTVLEKSKEAMASNSSVNISSSSIEKQSELEIGELFDLETINTLSELRNQNDKILITENKVFGYKKVDSQNLDSNEYQEEQSFKGNGYSINRGYNNQKRNYNNQNRYHSNKRFTNPKQHYSKSNNYNKYNSLNIYGKILYKCNNLDIENAICINKVSFDNIQECHSDNFIKNKSKRFNLITRDNNNVVHCYIVKERR